MNKIIRVLIVEDDLVDRLSCRRAIAHDADSLFVLLEAETGLQGLALAKSEKPDCILLDYHLPDMNGLEFLAALSADPAEIQTAVMLLTGADSAVVAAEAMKRGAADYLGKDVDGKYLELLPSAVQRMLRERQLLDEKRQAEAKFRSLVEQIRAITYIVGLDGKPLYISPQIALLGFSPEEWLANAELYSAQIHPDDRQHVLAEVRKNRHGGDRMQLEYRLIARDGNVLWMRDEAQAVKDDAGRNLFLQGILIDITQNKAVEEALKQSQAELRELAAHQENVKEAERKRIAQEIHDELGGLLTGIKANVSVYLARTERAGMPADQLLVDAMQLADDGFRSVRRVITDLRPSVLDQLGVWAALEWYAEQIEKRSDISCRCNIDDRVAVLEIAGDLGTMLFRIVQESLTNVVRHAGASKVEIKVTLDSNDLVLTVSDNGKGIGNIEANRESWGIVGMNERARYFGGELTISSESGMGSAVVLRLPLEHVHE